MTSKKEGEHVHKTRRSRSIVVLAMGLLMALALGGVSALADDWGSGLKTVTVNAADNEYKKDIEGIAAEDAVVIDVYKIASATRNSHQLSYDYALVAPFGTEELNKALADGDWEALADGAAKVVSDTIATGGQSVLVNRHGELGEKISLDADGDEGDGVWLVMPHGASKDPDSLVADSDLYTYSFNPIVVALPTKDGLDDSGALNSAYGNWIPDAEVTLKAEREDRLADLQINKIVDDTTSAAVSPEASTFVFHVVSVDENGNVLKGDDGKALYENYTSVYYDGENAPEPAILHRLPVGIKVRVTEEYNGASFKLAAGETQSQEVEIVGGQTAEVTFKNDSNNSGKRGHGIENQFKYDGESGDWPWTPKPDDGSATKA